jgi:hypothetical protein
MPISNLEAATMSGHRRIAEAGKESSPAAQPGTVPTVCYIAPAALTDVMFDQLEYLAAHGAQSCRRGCEDCARLAQVKTLLLVPFLSGRRQATPGKRAGAQEVRPAELGS